MKTELTDSDLNQYYEMLFKAGKQRWKLNRIEWEGDEFHAYDTEGRWRLSGSREFYQAIQKLYN